MSRYTWEGGFYIRGTLSDTPGVFRSIAEFLLSVRSFVCGVSYPSVLFFLSAAKCCSSHFSLKDPENPPVFLFEVLPAELFFEDLIIDGRG